MPDDLDRIQENEARWHEDLQKHATAARRGLIAVGFCHYCGDPIAPGLLFCPPFTPGESGCRDDFERLEAARRRNGG